MSDEESFSDTFEIRLPEQFQGIFHDDVLTIKVGEYSEATRYRFNKLPEEVRDIFFVGVRSQFPEILDEKQYDEMYREFNDWLMASRDAFVLETMALLRRTKATFSFTVYAKLGMQWIYLSTELST